MPASPLPTPHPRQPAPTHLSASSCTSRWRLCGASFIAKMGDPGTSPCTCLNTRRTSSSLRTCGGGGRGGGSSGRRSRQGCNGMAPRHRSTTAAQALHWLRRRQRCRGQEQEGSSGGVPGPTHLADSLAAAAPGGLEHHRVADAGAALERLAQVVDAGAVVDLGGDDAIGAGCTSQPASGVERVCVWWVGGGGTRGSTGDGTGGRQRSASSRRWAGGRMRRAGARCRHAHRTAPV